MDGYFKWRVMNIVDIQLFNNFFEEFFFFELYFNMLSGIKSK